MVNIFSFFTGKKKSKRSTTWTDPPTSTAHLVGTSSGIYAGSTPAQQSVKRQTSRFLSLRTRSAFKMIDSPQDALHRQSSVGSLRRKSSRRSTFTATLPKFGFEGDGGDKENLTTEFGVSGSTLGLENLVGLPKLRESEVDVIHAVELSVDEVRECWQVFGKALRDAGCDTVGLMLPQHHDPDPTTIHQLLALFLLHHRPSIAPSFPSISAYAASHNPRPLYSDLLRNTINDRPHPHELCQILKFSLQHLTPSQIPLIDSEIYIKFVKAEHAATYPLDAYSSLYVPRLSAGIADCLNCIFEVIAEIASKSEFNMMSGGKVCLILGWWLSGTRGGDGQDWQKVYKEWQIAGQRTEHLFYAWIRSQSTKSKLPTRLMELVEDYPFGESTLSTDHLPLPPPSSFPRHTLHVYAESESKLSHFTPRDLLVAALQAGETATAPLLSKLQKAVISEDQTMNIDHIIQLESQSFLRRSSGSSASAPPMFSITPSASRLTIPASVSGKSIDSQAHQQLTPLLELSEELGMLANTHPTSRAMGRSTSTSSTKAPRADWDDFSKTGFGDAPDTASKLDLQLSPRDLPLSLSRSPSTVQPLASQLPALKLKAVREERVEIGDAFLSFVEDAQLDKMTALFSQMVLLRLSASAALELSEEAPIEWLLVSVDYTPPPPIKPTSTITSRSTSPSKESTMIRKRFSLGGITSSFRRSSSMALKDNVGKKQGSVKEAGRGTPLAGQEGTEDVQPDVSKELGVGEMGQILKASTSSATVIDQANDQQDKVNTQTREVEQPVGAVHTEGPNEITGSYMRPASNGNDSVTATKDLISTASSPGGASVDHISVGPTNNVDPSSITSTKVQSPSATDKNPSHSPIIADWHYIAEGGANLVFGYHGRSKEFRNKALRIPKSPVVESEGDLPDISVLWRDELLPKLLSRDHLPEVRPVSLGGTWVASLVEHVQHTRPDFRAGIDLSTFSTADAPIEATLMDDLRTSASDNSHTVLAIEIKPKWGFLPSSQYVHPQEAAAIKSTHSRYELHQHMRGVETDYEPLDLYSGDMTRMTTAMQALWGLWSSSGGESNNWRVFVDGQAISVTEGYKIPGVGDSDDEATKTVPILSPVLWHSGVMQRLQHLQSTLDGTDISHLAQRFKTECPDSKSFDPALLPQPSAEELRQFIDLYISDPLAGQSDKWSLRESLVAYALSATFKDCSVFITCPLVSTSDGWKLDEPQATVKVIDLDLKPLANMGKWYDLDEKIWRHWNTTKTLAEAETKEVSRTVADPDPEATSAADGIADSQTDSLLATPAQIVRSAIPSRLTSSSTEALYHPTPDRQINDPLDYPGNTSRSGSIRTLPAQDASSTRALHTKTPEDSQPTTPKAVSTNAAETPASMSLSDALFISPPPGHTTTPGSMSLSDALFISPPAAAASPMDHSTPVSMSFSDALFISPSAAMTIANEHGRRGSNFGLEQPPMVHGQDDNESLEEKEEVMNTLKPDTPQRAARSAGPSPSPGLVAAASTLDLNEGKDATEDLAPSEEHPANSEAGTKNQQDLVIPGITSAAAANIDSDPAVDRMLGGLNPEEPHPGARQAGEPNPATLLPSTPSAEDQQHFRSVIAGVINEHTSKPKTDQQESTSVMEEGIGAGGKGIDITPSAQDRPDTPLADRQQHMRAVLAGVVSQATVPQHGQTRSPDPPSAEHQEAESPSPPASPLTVQQRRERAAFRAGIHGDEQSESPDILSIEQEQEESGSTPPFVTPMTFADEVEPAYPVTGHNVQAETTITSNEASTGIEENKPASM